MVLRYYYDVNERDPGGFEQTGVVANATGLDFAAVINAQQYWIDKGFLYSGPRQQVRSLDGPTIFMARITDRGIDFVEHPKDGWIARGVPTSVVNIFAAGDVAYAGGDQQVVHGDVTGTMAQGNASITTLPAFPIEQLRALLAPYPEQLRAAEEIERETKSVHPAWGKILAAVETIKSVGAIAESAKLVSDWLSSPAVSSAIHHFVTSLLT